jgi:hypothetical protein
MHARPFVGLVVAAVLTLGSIGAEGHQPVQGRLINRELDDGLVCRVAPDDVAVLQDLA